MNGECLGIDIDHVSRVTTSFNFGDVELLPSISLVIEVEISLIMCLNSLYMDSYDLHCLHMPP